MGDNPRIEELRRRVQMDPASIAFAALAEEYRREGRFDDAVATCATGLRRHPSYLSAHVTLGRALVATGQIDQARQSFEHVLQLAPENLAAIRGLAELHTLNEGASEEQGSVGAASAATASIAAPAESVVPRQGSHPPLALVAPIPHHTPTALPALVGLEDFLGAISRARGPVAGGLDAR
jgi:tetratricopeptide (TPR) repeat protein